MPIISIFFGIVIRMFYQEHEPPHFHAEYQGQSGTFDFEGRPLVGRIRSRAALRLIAEWAPAHRLELEALDSDTGGAPVRENRAAGVEKMPGLPAVVHAEHRGEYRIHVVFSDDVEATVDFSSWLTGPVFEPLKDVEYFKRFFVDGGTVVWPNGADIAPESLYERARASRAA